MAIGGTIAVGDSELFTGPLGVVRLGFDGYDLGKTVGDSNLTPDQDIKDVMYQQEGTKPADHVRTGIEYLVNATLGEISTTLVGILMAGISSGPDAGSDDAGHIDRSIFQSMLADEAKVLKIAACDENGVASALDEDIMAFYHAIPIITGELVNWGVDTQRNLPIQFRVKYHRFTPAELAALTRTSGGAFGYWGDPTDPLVDCTAVTWTDRSAPAIVTANAGVATVLTITFDENVEYQSAHVNGHYTVWVNDIAILSVSSADPTGTAVLAITFPASTFTSGDVISVTVSPLAIEDAAASANAFQGAVKFPCTESV